MTERPIIIAAIPLIAPTRDLFNKVLAQEILSPEIIDAALATAKTFCFSYRTKEASYVDRENGFLVDILSMPKDNNPANGLTVLSEPTQDGFSIQRLYIGANIPGFMLLHGRTCCGAMSINATIGFKGQDGQMSLQHRAAAESHANGHGYQFHGKCRIATGKALHALDHLWMHARNETHQCTHHAGFNVQSLDAGSIKPSVG